MNSRTSGRKPFYDAAADDGRLIDTELLSHALAFAAAADAYVGIRQQTDWKVVHFLLGRSIELTLKAYALHVGIKTHGLRKIGHDLAAALTFAKEHGLGVPELSAEDERSVGVLGALYRDKYLEYPLVMLHAFPRLRIVRNILHKIITAVCRAVWGFERYEAEVASRAIAGLENSSSPNYGS